MSQNCYYKLDLTHPSPNTNLIHTLSLGDLNSMLNAGAPQGQAILCTCSYHLWCWEPPVGTSNSLNPGPLQEQSGPLSAEPSLQPLSYQVK